MSTRRGLRRLVLLLAVAMIAAGTAPGPAAAAPADNFSIRLGTANGYTYTGGTPDPIQVLTTTTAGTAQSLRFSATGLPAGAVATFAPATATSGTGTVLTITTQRSTPVGVYPLTVWAKGTTATRSAAFELTVMGSKGCRQTDDSDVQIPDLGYAESALSITGCTGTASAHSTVEVHILHPYRGDLKISLYPDNGEIVLLDRVGGSADNVDQTFTVDLSAYPADNVFRLGLQDMAGADVGHLDYWILDVVGSGPAGGPTGCVADTPVAQPIPDLSTVESPLPIGHCTGTATATSMIEVHIAHPNRGDLIVTLITPNGSTRTLLNRSGGATDDVHQVFTTSLAGLPRNGTWRLRIQDAGAGNTGTLGYWSVAL